MSVFIFKKYNYKRAIFYNFIVAYFFRMEGQFITL